MRQGKNSSYIDVIQLIIKSLIPQSSINGVKEMHGFRNAFNITFTDQKVEDNLTDSAAQCASSDDVETSALVVCIFNN